MYDQLIYKKGSKKIKWEGTVSPVNGVGKNGQSQKMQKEWKKMQKSETGPLSYIIYTKIHSKHIKN